MDDYFHPVMPQHQAGFACYLCYQTCLSSAVSTSLLDVDILHDSSVRKTYHGYLNYLQILNLIENSEAYKINVIVDGYINDYLNVSERKETIISFSIYASFIVYSMTMHTMT